jgi:hypothetical protein
MTAMVSTGRIDASAAGGGSDWDSPRRSSKGWLWPAIFALLGVAGATGVGAKRYNLCCVEPKVTFELKLDEGNNCRRMKLRSAADVYWPNFALKPVESPPASPSKKTGYDPARDGLGVVAMWSIGSAP